MNYRVRPGDTLTAISRHVHVSARIIAKMNHILQPNRIAAGQLLRIPHLVPKLHGHHHALNSQTNTDISKTLSTDYLNAGGTKLGDLSMRYETGYSPGQENLGRRPSFLRNW